MFYFDKLGLNLFLGLPSVNYSDMSFNKDILNEYVLAQWKGKGLILGLGLQYRIIN